MKITVVEPGFEIMTPQCVIDQMVPHLERCGRVCYKSEDKIKDGSSEKFIDAIVRSGHESVIEHCNITVKFIGDRSMSHQLVRHRIAAFSQESQRYCDYGKLGFQVICPPKVASLVPGTYERREMAGQQAWFGETFGQLSQDGEWDTAEVDRARRWLNQILSAYCCYLSLRQDGVPPEDARSVLPNACKTEAVTTFNLRQWRHVFDERALNKHAQWQIRGIMQGILAHFADILPCVFSDQGQRLWNMLHPEEVIAHDDLAAYRGSK